MEEEFNQSEFSSSEPSDDDLDRAIEAARKAALGEDTANTELEDEDNNREDDDNPNDDAPGENDEDDESGADEANTPADDNDEDVVVTPQESRDKKSTPKSGEGSEDEKPLSRKERGKIIEEYRREAEAAQQREAALKAKLEAQERADEALSKEVARALGTDAEYEKAVEDGLAGDTDQAEKARVWKANRAFYEKLVDSAGKTYQERFAKQYWDTLQELPGIDMEVVTGKDLTAIVRHIHAAGASLAEEKYKTQIEKLQKDVLTWKGRAKSSGPQQAGQSRRSPLTGGGEPVDSQGFNWQRHYLKDGLPTDEFESLVRMHGFEAVASGKFLKRGK